MIHPIPGGRKYNPPNLRHAMDVCRVANAAWQRLMGDGEMRYAVEANIHEAVDPATPVAIYDNVDNVTISVYGLLRRLAPPDQERARLAMRG